MEYFGQHVLVPLAGIFFTFGLPVLAFVFFRLLAHRERMEMIRNGLAPGAPPRTAWRGAGAGLPSQMQTAPSPGSNDSAQVTLRKGITLTFIGLALTIGLSFIGFHDSDEGMSWRLGPWLLGGLVPMFAGIAQVTIAVLSGATLRPPEARVQPGPYGEAPFGQPPQPPPTGDGSYTYRPGNTQELRRPTPPPERRS